MQSVIRAFGFFAIRRTWEIMRAAELAKGKYLKYVDSDDLIYGHSLAIIVLRSVALCHRNTTLIHVPGRLTLGIYLIHPLIIDLLKKVGWPPPMSRLFGLPVNVFCVLILYAVATAVITRIPFLLTTV
jgi:hypothetical protein